MPSSSSCYKPVGAVSQTSLTSSAASTITQAVGSTAFMVTVTTNNVYWTIDGSTPSSSNGLVILAASQPLVLPVGKPSGLTHKFQAAAGTAFVNFQSLGDWVSSYLVQEEDNVSRFTLEEGGGSILTEESTSGGGGGGGAGGPDLASNISTQWTLWG